MFRYNHDSAGRLQPIFWAGFLPMIKWLLNLFKRRTPQGSYELGRDTVDTMLESSPHKAAEAEHLYHLASGGFNTNEYDRAFDRGVRQRLQELGYNDPY